jgi:hypothetical protein
VLKEIVLFHVFALVVTELHEPEYDIEPVSVVLKV